MSWDTEPAYPRNPQVEEIGITKREYASIKLAGLLHYRDRGSTNEYNVDDSRIDRFTSMAVRMADCLEISLST